MKHARIYALMLSLLLVSCGQSQPSVSTTDTPASNCPGTDFASFLSAFSEQEGVQRAFTTFPLEVRELDMEATPEPAFVTTLMNSPQLSYPLIPPEAARKADSLTLRVEDVSAHQVKVQLFKDSTDYQVFYHFNKTPDSCWSLIRIEDNSM